MDLGRIFSMGEQWIFSGVAKKIFLREDKCDEIS